MIHLNELFMRKAIEEAKYAASKGEYAIGSLVVLNDKIISIAHTELHGTNDPTAHGEIIVIRAAAKKLGSRYLKGVWLYTT